MLLPSYDLRWRDVVGALEPLEASALERLVAPLVTRAAARPGDDDDDREKALEGDIDRALLARYGLWAGGWRASQREVGGPVTAYDDDESAPGLTVARVVAGLGQWRAFIAEVAALSDAIAGDTAGLPVERAVAFAAARLLPLVVERTDASDAWYDTFGKVLDWHLERTGHDADRLRPVIEEVIRGRFASWEAPDEATAATTTAELGTAAARALTSAPEPRDGTAAWLAMRAWVFDRWPALPGAPAVDADAHARYIAGPEHARDPLRAERMAAALAACRASAGRGEPLTLERLAAWQALVLGADTVELRQADAWAKRGRERYPRLPDLRARLEAALADAGSDEPPAVRAARAYLDVCFFHPFADGNARAARLALEHVLGRAGLACAAVEPLFVVARDCEDRYGAHRFAGLVEYLAGPRRF